MTHLGNSFPGNETFDTAGAIPDDVMHEAEEVAGRIRTRDDAASVIARAILAERERCAKVADAAVEGRRAQEAESKAVGKRVEARDFQSMKFQAVEIAAAIRKGGAA